jgi:RNA polymerase sigma-70 factor (ECF subfamily)
MPGRKLSRGGREDARLVKSCRQGDADAFSQLVSKYQDSLYSIAYRMVGDREEARDIAQETFIKAYRAIDTFDLKRPFRSWLYGIGTNTAIDHLRRDAKVNDISIDAAFSPDAGWDRKAASGVEAEPPDPHADSPEDVTVAREMQEIVQGAVYRLPENYRAVIVLHHLEGMTFGEVGKVMGVPRNTAKTWAHRARGMLCEALEGVM